MKFKVRVQSRPVSSAMSSADYKKAFDEINLFHRQELMKHMTNLKSTLILQYDQNFFQTQKKLQNFTQALKNFESNLEKVQQSSQDASPVVSQS